MSLTLENPTPAAASQTVHSVEALEQCLDGAAIVDSSGRVTFANTALVRLIEEGCGFQIERGRLFVDSPADQRKFSRALERCLATDWSTTTAFSFWGTCSGHPTVVSVIPVQGQDFAASEKRCPLAVVLVVSIKPFDTLDRRLLIDAFDLTEAEASIARAIVEGRTLVEIAADRGTTIHTIRSQLKSIMSKLGVGRQVELVTLLSRCANAMQWTKRPFRLAGCRPARPRSAKAMGA